MKVLLSLILLTLSLAAHSKGEMFQKRKDFRVSHIGKKISVMQTAQSCYRSASDNKAMKACSEAKKSSMESLKKEGEAFKSSMKAEREKRKAEKKSKK